MKFSLTKDTLTAFLIVVTLAGAALGLGDETEAALSLEGMAKLGIHRMPNGDWMQEAEAAEAKESEPAGVDHTIHIAQPDPAPDQNIPGDNESRLDIPQQVDHEALGH